MIDKKLKNILKYFLNNYPFSDELSNSRLTKMVYLADWMSAVKFDKQITDINWFFDHHGPYVDDIINLVKSDPDFSIQECENFFGGYKRLITLKREDEPTELDQFEVDLLDKIIKTTEKLNYQDFIDFVYNTYPIKNSDKFSDLNLKSFAKNFLKEKESRVS